MGNAFYGAKEFYYTDWQLQYTAGSARWFPQFTPVNFIALRFMFELLKHFLRHICCHIGGAIATYIATLQTNFQRVSFFRPERFPASKFTIPKGRNSAGNQSRPLPFHTVPELATYLCLQIRCKAR